MDDLARLLRDQDGVVARRQLLSLPGMDRTTVARLVRRRELVEVQRGVYVDHTRPPSWQQRAWAAVLWAWPAALADQSAWRAFEGPGRRSRDVDRLHVVVDRDRRLTAPPGIVLHRRSGFGDRVLWNLGPPRLRLEEAVLDVALGAPDELGTIAALADAAGGRRTTSARLRAALDARPWVPRRALIGSVLDDVEAGSCSVLEREYLARVERPHGLPVGRRQARAEHRGRTMWQDVAFEEWGLVVELDGRFDHVVMTDRDRDLDRDLATAAAGGQTLRLGYGQVLSRSCATADRVARVLASRGWSGATQRCGKCGAPDQPG
jgi:very-short-patch-repair endonuclease